MLGDKEKERGSGDPVGVFLGLIEEQAMEKAFRNRLSQLSRMSKPTRLCHEIS